MIRKQKNNGFTLVELLVCIVIIVILAAITLPIISKVIDAGRTTQGAQNLRSISSALMLHCADYNNFYPSISYSNNRTWTNSTITDYLPLRPHSNIPYLANEAFVCPNARYRDSAGSLYPNPDFISRTYSTTSVLIGNNPEDSGEWGTSWPRHALSISQPSQAMLIVDAAQESNVWYTRSVIQWSLAESEFASNAGINSRWIDYRQSGKAHVLFADGHLETLDPDEMKLRATQARWEARQ